MTSFVDRVPTLIVRRILGPEALDCIVRVLDFLRERYPDRQLGDLGMVEIEGIARWHGEPGAFSAGLKESACRSRTPVRKSSANFSAVGPSQGGVRQARIRAAVSDCVRRALQKSRVR